MKLIIVQYDNSVDTSAITSGKTVSVIEGTTELANGKVLATVEAQDPPVATPVLVAHEHAVAGTLTAISGPAVPTP